MSNVGDIRDALKLIPLLAAQQATSIPDLRSIYTPLSHEGALDPNREIVVGDRGVGKSFWSSVLTNSTARTAIGAIYKKIGLSSTDVKLGFSEVAARSEYPSPRTLRELLTDTNAEAIWHAVIINSFPSNYRPKGWTGWSWSKRVKWIETNSEASERFASKFNANLHAKRRRHLIVFDALDRSATGGDGGLGTGSYAGGAGGDASADGGDGGDGIGGDGGNITIVNKGDIKAKGKGSHGIYARTYAGTAGADGTATPGADGAAPNGGEGGSASAQGGAGGLGVGGSTGSIAIKNAGWVEAKADGVRAIVTGPGGTILVKNEGSIQGGTRGIYANGPNGTTTIINSGFVTAKSWLAINTRPRPRSSIPG